MKKYITIALLAFSTFGFVGAQVMVPQTTSKMTMAPVGDVEDTQLTCIDLQYTLKLRSKDATTNNEVTALQEFLLDIGLLDTDPTGYFGAATLKAVKAFQKQSGLLNSGLVGTYTRQAIKEKSCNTEAKKPVELPPDCVMASDLCNPSDPEKNKKKIYEKPEFNKNTLTVYRNGQVFITANDVSKEQAYQKCKEVINSNESAAMVVQVFKCTWNNEVIYSPSAEVLDNQQKNRLGYLVIYKNGEVIAKADSMSKEDTYAKCKAYQASYASSALKCLWNGEVIYATSNEVLETKTKPNLGTLVVYKNGEILTKAASVSKDDAYNKCKYVQASYSSTAIKCLWNDEVIYATSGAVLEKTGEPINNSGVMNPSSSVIPTGEAVQGASTMCVDLTRNFHRGDESEDTRLLQTFLNANEFMDSEVSGFYGDKTVEAVRRYQRIRGLPETGMVYDFTRLTIKNDSCR